MSKTVSIRLWGGKNKEEVEKFALVFIRRGYATSIDVDSPDIIVINGIAKEDVQDE